MLSWPTKSATAFLDRGDGNSSTTAQHVFRGTVTLVGQPSQRHSLLTRHGAFEPRGETGCLLVWALGAGQSEGPWLRFLKASCTDWHGRCVAAGARFFLQIV